MIDLAPFAKQLNGTPVAVFGLGVSGLCAVRALLNAGARVDAWDDSGTARETARGLGATPVDFENIGFSGHAVLILSPGIPFTRNPHPVVTKARAAGVDIIGDLELLHRAGHGRRTVGITGTNGKSTTTALTAHILNACGVKTVAGGNIGAPALDLALPPSGGVVALEISSYQMDLCPAFRPDIAVHLNLTADHLDRHGSMDSYAAAKARIFEGPGIAVCGIDDEHSKAMFDAVKEKGARKLVPVSAKGNADGGVFIRDGRVIDDIASMAIDAGDAASIRTLPGVHNQQNLCAAYAIARAFDIPPSAIMEAASTYPGLPHRQFLTRVINGIAYVNDSKATNADAAAKALACYRPVYWIAGGRPKDRGLDGLEGLMDRVKCAYLIGEAMEDFARWLDNRGVPNVLCGSLETATRASHADAQASRGEPGGAGTVLLSPACASWDQFRNFEHRGDVFASLVNGLEEEMAA